MNSYYKKMVSLGSDNDLPISSYNAARTSLVTSLLNHQQQRMKPVFLRKFNKGGCLVCFQKSLLFCS